MKEPSKGLRTLRIYATKFGLKTTTTKGLLIKGNGFEYVYKQSSEDIPIGDERKDWIEDLNGNIIVNPFKIYDITLPYKIKIKAGDVEYLVENHGEYNDEDIKEVRIEESSN